MIGGSSCLRRQVQPALALLAFSYCRLLGPALIILGVTLITAEVFYFFQRISVHYARQWSLSWWGLVLPGLFILANILHNYTVCIVYDPGRTAGLRTVSQMITRLADSYTRSLPPQAVHEVRWCDKCASPKPRRVHHCSVCDTCIMKMDHHCECHHALVVHHP